MEVIRNAAKQDILLALVAFQTLCAVPLLICSLVVSGTANAGFNCFLTACLNLAYVGGTFFVVRNSTAPIAYGFVIGSGAMMLMNNLMTGIYWGQLSHCIDFSAAYDFMAQYDCGNTTAYGAVSAFAVLLFLAQAALVTVIVVWRSELIQEVGRYVGVAKEEGAAAAAGAKAVPTADF